MGGLLSRVKPPPGTKGAFVPGGGFTRDKRGGHLSLVKPPPGAKGPFVPGRGSTRDKRYFWAGRENSQPAAHLQSRVDLPPGTKGARFPSFPPNLMFVFVSFYFSFKIGFHLLIQLINFDSKNYGTKFLISIQTWYTQQKCLIFIQVIGSTKFLNFLKSYFLC